MTRDSDPQGVLDAIPDGLLVFDQDGRVTRVNSEACRILETSEDALAGCPVEQVLGGEHPLCGLVHGVLASRRPAARDEVRVNRRLEPDVDVDLAVAPIDDGGGGVVVMVRDRTIRDSLHEMVSQREQLDSYGQIAAGIAHEVKNPLGGIRGAAELLAVRATEDRARRTAELIVRETDRISSLVEDLMVFARGDALEEAPLNLHFVIDGVLDLLAMDPLSERVEVERFYDPSIPEFLGDGDRLTQVLLNLCRNALQAMEEEGGTLTLTTRMSLDRRLETPEGRRVPAVIVAVSDTGAGIPADVLSRLATPFFTTRPKGTGLGLAVSRHWVTRHGGTLRIASQPGEGTTARVALPLRRRAERRPSASTSGKETP